MAGYRPERTLIRVIPSFRFRPEAEVAVIGKQTLIVRRKRSPLLPRITLPVRLLMAVARVRMRWQSHQTIV